MATVLNMVLPLEKVNQATGTCYVACDLVNVFFSNSTRKEDGKQFAFLCSGQQCLFMVLPPIYINSSALCHNVVQRDLDYTI